MKFKPKVNCLGKKGRFNYRKQGLVIENLGLGSQQTWKISLSWVFIWQVIMNIEHEEHTIRLSE